MRLFVGVPLSRAVVAELSAIVQRLRSDGDGLRWAGPETWHITLKFLGQTGEEQYRSVVAGLRAIHAPAVPVRLEGLGFFDRTGILFAGVKVSTELLELEQGVERATAACGFAAETRPYRPHITLARSKGARSLGARGKGRGKPGGLERTGLERIKARIGRETGFSKFAAGEFLLYESFLGPGGSRYEVRERFGLGAG
jgi:2'-5' RNA ligase